ncbi:hypothetical protein ACQFX9_08640 [Aliinostoc sp. HNIBRCY26]
MPIAIAQSSIVNSVLAIAPNQAGLFYYLSHSHLHPQKDEF